MDVDEETPDPQISINRLSSCEVCNANDAKYCCPKCEVKTCCLSCVNIHKKELECDGIRDRTKFVYAKDFTSLDLHNDYKLLEECSRFVYGKQKNKEKRYTSIDRHLPSYLSKLKRIARTRGTVLLIMLEHFSRRRANTTRVINGQLHWRVEFLFPNATPTALKIAACSCDENDKLAKLVQVYFDPNADVEGKECLMFYQSAGLTGVRIFLKAERVKGNKFHELDLSLSLKENLAGKCIVEFPIVFVMLKDHAHHMVLVDSDDEAACEEEENKKRERQFNRRLYNQREKAPDDVAQKEVDAPKAAEPDSQHLKRRQPRELTTAKFAREEKQKIEKEIEQERKKKPKNLLFVTGYSSDEESCASGE